MPVLPLISFAVVGVIWLAVLLSVLSDGFGQGHSSRLWLELFVLLGFPLVGYWSYLRIRVAREALERGASMADPAKSSPDGPAGSSSEEPTSRPAKGPG